MSDPNGSEADQLWDGVTSLSLPADYRGEGIIIGTIDTGISPSNQSFADVSDDGYDHVNPLGVGNYLGACDPGSDQFDAAVTCNDKLIGAYVFGSANEIDADSAIDYDGHGSHTASTSGGGVVLGVSVETPTGTQGPFDISGVAPRANIISYLGCCTESGLTMSIEQAIIDQVDVINYSIGADAPSSNLWGDFDSLGFLSARAAGIFVATSNGNAGPGDATTGSPADAPWLTSVGASTHNRRNASSLSGMTSTNGPLGDMSGKSLTSALGSTPIIDAASVGDGLCEDASGHEAAFIGKIVVCTRGVNGRVAKSENVAAQGAAGFVLANDEANGDDISGDAFAVPGVAVTYDDGVALKTWLANGSADHVAVINATSFLVNDVYGDRMAAFSSRGPNQVVDVVSPAVTAPGVDILAAFTDTAVAGGGDVHAFSSGTSMSGPHVAGAGALLVQARPGWTPAQMQSALMTTAVTSVLNHDGAPATPYAQGSGRIDVARAVMAGLLFDETEANYLGSNPADGGDPKTLNIPSFANSQCLSECVWERVATVPSSAPDDVTWNASYVSDAGLTLDIDLSVAEVSAGDSITISVTADVAVAPEGEVLFGRITLTPSDVDVPSVTMPVAVIPSDAVLPPATEIQTRRDAGSQVLTDIQSSGVSDFSGSLAGWVQGAFTEGELSTDSTNDDMYDDLSQVDVTTTVVPAGTARFIAEIVESAAPDIDLAVGTGSTPSAATEVCVSASGGSFETCDLIEPDAGTYWILVQSWEGTGNADPYTLSTAVVANVSAGNGIVAGPDGAVGLGEPFDVTATWDIPDMAVGDIWYSTAILGSSPGTPGDIGVIPLRLERLDDDVTKTALVASAEPGDTVDYEITVQPNVAKVDLEYTIVDTVPDGLTIDPASVTGGGVVDGQTITWTVPVPTPVGAAGDYVLSTPVDSVQCAAWSGFFDLGSIPIALDPSMDGDSIAGSFFSDIGPFEHYGASYPALTVTEDGMMTVTDDLGADPYDPQAIPDATTPNGVIAPLWSDLELSVADGSGMRFAVDPDAAGGGVDRVAIVQWDDPFEYTVDASIGASVGQFQAWIYAEASSDRPEATFEYNTIGSLPSTVTVGVENEAGDRASALLAADDPAGALLAGGTLCLDYEGPIFDPVVLSYSVSVPADAAGEVVTNVVGHLTDDPYATIAEATADLEILAAGLSASPTMVNFGEVLAGATSDPETVTVTNAGTVDLTIDDVTTTAPFGVDATGCTDASVAPGDTCDLVVTFTPVDDQAAAGAISISSNAPDSPHEVMLSGNGTSESIMPVVPGRYWDTRDEPTLDGLFSDTGQLQARSTFAVQIAGRGDVPANAIGVVANLTVIAPSELGFATLFPCSDEVPTASHVNYFPGEVLANNAVVPLNADGEVCVFTRSPSDFALDVNGYRPFGSPLVGMVPTRYADTRTAADTVTFDGEFQAADVIPGGSAYEVQIAGRGDVPADASAVMINVTAVAPEADGFLTVYPCGDRPVASTLNYFTGQVVPNGAVTSLSDDGTICVFTRASTHLIVDVSGYIPNGAVGLEPIVPARLLDTRTGEETVDGESNGDGRVAAEQFIEVQVTGRAGIPDEATAALFNIGAVFPDGPGYATLYPCGDVPRTSNVNHVTGNIVRANNALTQLSDDGTVCIFVKSGTDLILDVTGWIG